MAVSFGFCHQFLKFLLFSQKVLTFSWKNLGENWARLSETSTLYESSSTSVSLPIQFHGKTMSHELESSGIEFESLRIEFD